MEKMDSKSSAKVEQPKNKKRNLLGYFLKKEHLGHKQLLNIEFFTSLPHKGRLS